MNYADFKKGTFEDLVNAANSQYARKRVAFINKSENGYEGIYKRKKLSFVAKFAKGRSFDLNEISDEQLEHFEKIELRGGYCFLLIEFLETRTVYFVPFSIIRHYVYHSKYGGRSYIPENDLNYYAYGVNRSQRAILDYLVLVDHLIGNEAKKKA